MNPAEPIEACFSAQTSAKQSDLRALHRLILELSPGCQLWFVDGRDETGKVVSNPNIGYGLRTLTYADGSTKPFYRVGTSPNTTGISVYILGIDDRTYLPNTYGKTIGKATVTGYCIKFKALKDINLDVLKDALQYGLEV
jgi:hypothetical protein